MIATPRFDSISPIVSVDDLPRGIEWYERVLGFTVAWRSGDPAELAGLCRDRVELSVGQRGKTGPQGPSQVYVRVTGIDAYYEHIQRAGAAIAVPIGDRPYGLRDFSATDPSGNRIDFGQALEADGLRLARVILFAKDIASVARFYEGVVGLRRLATADDSAEFVSFEAGGCQLCLHQIPKRWARDIQIEDPPRAREAMPIKLAFHADDVDARRAELIARGARMGKVQRAGSLALCDGVDPEGNVFQISNRRAL